MNKKTAIGIIGIALLLAIAAYNISLKEKELEIKDFSFAQSVDAEMNFVPSNGAFYAGEDIWFIMEIERLETRNQFASTKVEAEITSLLRGKTEQVFRETILEQTMPVQNNRITVAGKISTVFAEKGANTLKLIITDKISGKTKTTEKIFRVEEWPEEYGVNSFDLNQHGQ